MLSEDLCEVASSLKELEIPHFHHEVVKRGMVLAMDKTDAHCEMMSTLFTFLFAEGVIAGQQFDIGFQRVKEVGIVTACACTTARSLAGVCRSVTDTVVLRASVCVVVCVCVLSLLC